MSRMGLGQILEENERLRRDLAERDERLAAQLAEIEALKTSNADLARTLDIIRRKEADRRNERYVPAAQGEALPFPAVAVPPARPPTAEPIDPADPTRPPRKPRGTQRRRDLSERDDLKTREVRCVADVSGGCASCGGELHSLGETVSWRIDWVPGEFVREKVVREKCACKNCPGEGVLTAPEPAYALRYAMCGNRLLARVLVDKFADGLPLNRQSKRMEREGVDIGTAVLSSWVVGGAALFVPLVDAIDKRLLAQKCLQGDDTGFPVQDGTDGKLRKGRLWCYTDQQEVRFRFSDTKEGRFPVTFLGGFQGQALLVDCGSEFNEVVRQTGVQRGGCWSHLRRYFFDARHHHPAEGELALVAIRDLFLIERRVFGTGLEPDVVRALRQTEAKPIVDAFFKWTRDLSTTTRPKSTLGDAVRYALNHEAEFRLFLDVPEMPMHNNLSELQLRGPVVGRKAWLFARSEGGAHAAATMFTLTASCVLQGIDPLAYLIDVLDRLPDHPASRIHELTPLNWRLAREQRLAAK